MAEAHGTLVTLTRQLEAPAEFLVGDIGVWPPRLVAHVALIGLRDHNRDSLAPNRGRPNAHYTGEWTNTGEDDSTPITIPKVASGILIHDDTGRQLLADNYRLYRRTNHA